MILMAVALTLLLCAGSALAAPSMPITVTVEGDDYVMPCTLGDFSDNGWEVKIVGGQSDYADNCPAKETGTAYLTRSEKSLYLEFINDYYTEKPYATCMVTQLGASMPNLTTNPIEVIWEGIEPGIMPAEFEAIVKGCRTWSDEYFTYFEGEDEQTNLKYTIDYMLINDGRIGSFSFTFEHLNPPEEVQAELEDMEEYRPSSFADYAAPEAMGDDIFSGTFRMGNKLYQLPVPMYVFADDGWQIDDSAWLAAGMKDFFYEASGAERVEFYVHNIMMGSERGLDDVPAKLINCESDGIIVYDPNVDFELPRGLRIGMSEKELEAMLPELLFVTRREYSNGAVGYQIDNFIYDDPLHEAITIEVYVENGEIRYLGIHFSDIG